MEQGGVAGWSDVDKIDRICRTHAQGHISQQGTQNARNQKSKYFKESGSMRVLPLKCLLAKEES